VKVFQTKLANRIAYAESATQGSGVHEWKDLKAKAEFNQLAQEVFKEVVNYSKSL
jgi:cellulose biosynthesis protein BcsQ